MCTCRTLVALVPALCLTVASVATAATVQGMGAYVDSYEEALAVDADGAPVSLSSFDDYEMSLLEEPDTDIEIGSLPEPDTGIELCADDPVCAEISSWIEKS